MTLSRLFGDEPRMRALLPNIHQAAERHERIEAIQALGWLTFIELYGMPVGRKDFHERSPGALLEHAGKSET
jgi:hypothetical protein